MPGPNAPAPRMGGGFNPGMGGASNEHLDENAMQQAMSQMKMGQQGTTQQSALQAGQGGSKAQTDFSQMQAESPDAMANMAAQQQQTQQKTRPVGTLQEELVTRPVEDIKTGLLSLFDINALLGINPQVDTPEEQAKKRQMHQRWQRLNQEQQQVAQENYQRAMQQKQQEEEEKQMRKQQEEQANAQSIQAPASPQKGPQGPGGSKKQRAVTKLQNDRKSLGNAKGSN